MTTIERDSWQTLGDVALRIADRMCVYKSRDLKNASDPDAVKVYLEIIREQAKREAGK